METTTLDTIARSLSSSMTRRSALRGIFAGAAAAVAGGTLSRARRPPPSAQEEGRQEQAARSRQPASRPAISPERTAPAPTGSRCQSSSQCVSGYICEVPVNGSNSDRYCSGGPGAICGAPNADDDDTAPFCAWGIAAPSAMAPTPARLFPTRSKPPDWATPHSSQTRAGRVSRPALPR
jgi:hypothetical protein